MDYIELSKTKLTSILLKEWGLDRLELIGQFKSHPGGKGGWFNNIRHPLTLEKLFLPSGLGAPSIYSPSTFDGNGKVLEGEKIYFLKAEISQRKTEDKKANPFNLIGKGKNEIENNDLLDKLEISLTPEQITLKRKGEVQEILVLEQDLGAVPARGYAQAIQGVIGTMWSGPDRFIFELIQNADDLPAAHSRDRHIHFKLLPNHLLFLHNGLPFQKEHVKAISDVGGSTKRDDSDATGYKGVGFKSVFRDAACAYINSGGYSFRFDSKAVTNPNEVPWQTWPLWTEQEEYPDEIKQYVNFFDKKKHPVAIALQVGKKSQSYKDLFVDLFKDPRFALFLRNLNYITVTGDNLSIKIERREIAKDGLIELIIDNEQEQYIWYNYKINIPKALRDQIKGDFSFPEKLTKAKSITISFAVKANHINSEVEVIEDSVIYSYLPTSDSSYKFPFLVNADFITDSSRQYIQWNNVWNEFLFSTISELIPSKLIKDIITKDKDFASTAYQLIPGLYQITQPNQQNHRVFNEVLVETLRNSEFVLTSNLSFTSPEGAILDNAGLYNILPKLYEELLLNSKLIVHPLATKDLGMLVEKKLVEIEGVDFQQVLDCIDLAIDKGLYNLNDCISFLEFLFDQKDPIIVGKTYSTNWLFDQNLSSFSPSENTVFGVIQEPLDNLFPYPNEVRYIHPEIIAHLQKSDKKLAWFSEAFSLIQPLNKQISVEEILLPKLKAGKVELSEYDKVLEYLFEIYKAKNLSWLGTLEERRKLKIPVRLQRENESSGYLKDCYLPDIYLPDYPFESLAELLAGNFDFVWSAYFPQERREKVSDFLHELGAKNSPGSKLLQDELLPQLQKGAIPSDKHDALLHLLLKDYAKRGADHYPQNILSGLGHIQLKTVEGIGIKASQSYFSGFYDETLKVAEVLGTIPDSISSEYVSVAGLESVRDFFKKIGVRSLTVTEAISANLKKRLADGFTSIEETLKVVEVCFSLIEQGIVEENHKLLLRAIPLNLKDGSSSPACCCYLGTEFNPHTNLEELSVPDEKRFLSEKYLALEKSPEEIKSFLTIWFDVKENFKPKWISEISRPEAEARPELLLYLNWIDSNGVYPSTYAGFKHQHGILNLLLINNLELVTNGRIAEVLAKAISSDWQGKPNSFPEAKYWVFGNTTRNYSFKPTLGFNCFYFSSKESEKITDGTPLLANRLKDIAPKNAWVAEHSLGLKAIEQYFGLKTELDVNEAIQSFIEICSELKDDAWSRSIEEKFLKSFEKVLKYFEKPETFKNLSEIEDVKSKFHLPASDNSWQPVEGLFYLKEGRYYVAGRADLMKRFDQLNSISLNNFLDKIGIPVILEEDFELAQDNEDRTSNESIVEDRFQRNSIFEIISFAKNNEVDDHFVQQKLESLEHLSFSPTKSIVLTCTKIDDFVVPAEDRCQIIGDHFFYSGDLWSGWRHFGILGQFLNEKLDLGIDPKLLIDLLLADGNTNLIKVLRESNWPVPPFLKEASSIIEEIEKVSTLNIQEGFTFEVPKADTKITNIKETTFQADAIEEPILSGDLDKDAQIAVNIEAVELALNWLKGKGYEVTLQPEINILEEVVNPRGEKVTLVVKSVKGKFVSLNPSEFQLLGGPNSFALLVTTADEIYKVSLDEILADNPYRFIRIHETESSKEELAELANEFQYFSTFQFRFLKPAVSIGRSVVMPKEVMGDNVQFSTEDIF